MSLLFIIAAKHLPIYVVIESTILSLVEGQQRPGSMNHLFGIPSPDVHFQGPVASVASGIQL